MKKWIAFAVLLAAALSACSSAAQPVTATRKVKLAPASQLSPELQKAPPKVREAYQFALANPELLKRIPCYCGCGSMGHKSNLDCYVKEVKPDGKAVFEDHALG
jgi:hypothetical protein